MERSLLWIALAIGGISWICGLLLTRAPRRVDVRADDSSIRPFVITAVLLPLLVFLATAPTRPPLFATGHGLGNGFLLGGVGALLVGWVLARAARAERADAAPWSEQTLRVAGVVVAPYALGLVVTAIPLLFLRASLLDTLLGVAIGWFAVTFVLVLGLLQERMPTRPGERSEDASDPSTQADAPNRSVPSSPSSLSSLSGLSGLSCLSWGAGSPRAALVLASGVGFVTTLCATAALGEMRGTVLLTGSLRPVSWSALAMVFAAGLPLALLIPALPSALFARLALKIPFATVFAGLFGRLLQTEDRQQAGVHGLRILVSTLLLLGLGKLLALRVLDVPPLFRLMAMGVGMGLLAWWLATGRSRDERAAKTDDIPAGWNGMLALYLALAGFMVAYQLLAGFGVGLLLIGAWLATGLALATAPQPAPDSTGEAARAAGAGLNPACYLTVLLLFGTILLLYRLFVMRFEDDLRGVLLVDQYGAFGFLTGALLPTLLAGYLWRAGAVSPGSRLLRLVATGALTLAVPALVLLLWGVKCALALLIGTTLSAAAMEIRAAGIAHWAEPPKRVAPHSEIAALLPALLAVAVALALTQWTHHLLPLAALSREQKVRVLMGVTVSLMALIAASDVSARFSAWRRQRQVGGAPTKGAAQ